MRAKEGIGRRSTQAQQWCQPVQQVECEVWWRLHSLVTAAVRPTPLLPRPVVDTAWGATFMTALSSWDLATPGSPTSSMLTSPLQDNKQHQTDGRTDGRQALSSAHGG